MQLPPLAGLVVLVAYGVHAQTTVTVNASLTYQTMDGFGFSEAFGHANEVLAYPEDMRTKVLDLLFSPSVGIGATILRNRIGSGDGSWDSILPTSPGCPTCTPTYVWGTDRGQVWITKEAIKRGVKYVYANAWSAPGFMKTNGNETNGGSLCGVSGTSCSSGNWMQAYANMLVQYVKYYQQEGITVTHLGFLNEPEYTTSYSSMRSTGTQAADFLKILKPTVTNAGLSTKITCCDSMGWDNQVTMTAQIKAADAEQYLNVYTSHSYSNPPDTQLVNVTNKAVWQSEVADLSGSLLPNNWYASGAKGEGLTIANDIMSAIVSARLSAYLYWVGAEPGNTNAALILTEGTTITVAKRAWAFAQWARYVRPGAVRLGTTGSGTDLRFTAFRNTDGTISVQVINNGASSAAVRVAGTGFTAKSVTAFTSAQGNDLGSLSASLSGGVAAATVPARSMTTFIIST